jgi:hypothetical protein
MAPGRLLTRCCHSAIDFAVMHSSVLAQRCGTIGREGPSWMLSAGARLAACPALPTKFVGDCAGLMNAFISY